MQEERYLSEAIDLENIKKGKLNLITTPTGSGKSTFALNMLPELVPYMYKIIYLIDTTAGRDQIAQHENVQQYSDNWRDDILNDAIAENNKIVVMTYAKFGAILKNNLNFTDHIDMIIADELHNAFWPIGAERAKLNKQWPHASSQEINDILSKMNLNYIAVEGLEIFSIKKYVIGLTATPSKVLRFFREDITEIRTDAATVAYRTLETLYYRNLKQVLGDLKGQKALVYVPTITSMKSHIEFARNIGIRCEGIWSLHNLYHGMDFTQTLLRHNLINKQQIPEEIDMLFINKAYETSINIFSHLDAVVVHTTDTDAIIQARGRYRHHLDRLYLLGNESNTEIIVPEEYLNVNLNTNKKTELCELLMLRDTERKILKWPSVKKKLIETGYIVEDKRTKSERYSIISLPEPI